MKTKRTLSIILSTLTLSIALTGCGVSQDQAQKEITQTMKDKVALMNKGDIAGYFSIVDQSKLSKDQKETMDFSVKLVDALMTEDAMKDLPTTVEKVDILSKVATNEYKAKLTMKSKIDGKEEVQTTEKVFHKVDGKWMMEITDIAEVLGSDFKDMEDEIKNMSPEEKAELEKYINNTPSTDTSKADTTKTDTNKTDTTKK